ncbi:hypothetical protein [Chitinophaga rhizosphaerae]|uniref:hypothetical protein n=1 Tax=Chitinophaga rhizosphaerae TaxID=1864947 RepID=UPI000F80165A|nr:hypothetical protein [Chitinophaga rhizosphaerae]
MWTFHISIKNLAVWLFKAQLLLVGILTSSDALSQRRPFFNTSARVLGYEGNSIREEHPFSFLRNKSVLVTDAAKWHCERTIGQDEHERIYTFQLAAGAAAKSGVSVDFVFDDWDSDNYVIMPSAAYNGNRFDVLPYSYPPLFKPEDYNRDLPVTITDIPRLNKYDGPSRMDFNTGDLSTPAVGIYFPRTKSGIWILTEQATELGNNALIFRESEARDKATFTILAPGVREQYYSMARMSHSNETGVDFKQGDRVVVRYKVYTYKHLASPADLNNRFIDIRKSYGSSVYVNQLPFSKAFELMERQENEWWSSADSLYTLGGQALNLKWQLGWVGGLMVTLPLSEAGGDSSATRAFMNYHKIITQSQAKSGLFYGCGDGRVWCSDCFGNPHPDNLHLLRKNADALYFIYKYAYSRRYAQPEWQMPVAWKIPLRMQAEAFVKLWESAGQFGQFVDVESGEIVVGGSNSAVIAIGGLALASKFEGNPEYLEVAEEAARYYYNNYTKKGISCGGPGEILQNNDSESAFAMLESFMTLYEVTGEREWIRYAEDAAAFCATWMVTYDYSFPGSSLFGKLDMKTTGAVWANTQNKHGGPGICTASGDCLFKLYRATGNRKYLEMIYDVAHNIMQYISRDDRPIKDQQTGWINERVNLSDWEGKGGVGDIFHGNTWAQVSAMLTVAQIPGIYINPHSDVLVVFDHVHATLKDGLLTVTNPTHFDANVRVFLDTTPELAYPQGFISRCPKIYVKAGETKVFPVAGFR